MGDMNKKHRVRLHNLEHELNRLEAVKKPNKAQSNRITKLRGELIPKARRNV